MLLNDPAPLVLTGMMGSGKSTVGLLLAAELKRDFFDLDEIIERKCNRKILQLFEEIGEAAFRVMEEEILADVLQKSNSLIAAGGGVLLSSVNRQLLAGAGRVLLLEASLLELERRLSNNDLNRPLLSGDRNSAEQLEHLYGERRQLYHQTADIVVNTDGLTPLQVVAVIRTRLEKSHV
jgi:shikimate kinase